MPIDWKNSENNERLIACLFVSFEKKGYKVDYNEVAALFGSGATYDAIKGNFRKIRATAQAVKDESASAGKDKDGAKAGKKASSASKGVASGRVTKKVAPSKRTAKVGSAEEEGEDII